MLRKWFQIREEKRRTNIMPYWEGNCAGLRVVRGKDWSWGDQDGGEGMVGTVVESNQEDGSQQTGHVSVIWDNGAVGKYRAGYQNAYDLFVFDTGAASSKQGVSCEECQKDVVGIRWACMDCTLVSLCTNCYMANLHNLTHGFERIDTGNSQPAPVAARCVSKQVEIRGSFPGAIVVRGPDWDWDEQDGGEGQVGKIVEVETWQGKSKRNVARVQWMKTGISNIYRVGHKGKVDIKCVQPATFSSCYKAHLPCLGYPPESQATYEQPSNAIAGAMSTSMSGTRSVAMHSMEDRSNLEEGAAYSMMAHQPQTMCSMATIVAPSMGSNIGFPIVKQLASNNMSREFQIGEKVRMLESKENLIELQKNHGGFHPNMETDFGKIGVITQITEAGDIVVSYEDTKSLWTINPAAISKVPTGLVEGDTVQLLDEKKLFKKFYKEDIGEWCDDYAKVVGLAAKITKVYLDGNYKVAVGNLSLVISTKLIQNKVAQISATVCQNEFPVDGPVNNTTGGRRVRARSNADFYRPTRDEKTGEKTSVEGRLLRAAKEGDVEEVKEILESHPLEVNTPALDETPLLAAITEEREDIIEHLLKQGASANIKDKNNHTAVHLALSIGNDRIIELVLKAAALDVDVLDVKYKLDYLQFAAVCGSIRGTELLIRRFPGLLKKPSSGPSPLHFAVFSSKQLMEYLIKEAGFSVDSTDFDQKTPLHIALLSNNIDSCHLLTRLGCDLNAKDAKGNTALHIVMASRGRKSLRDHRWYSIVMKRYLGRQKEQKDINNTALQQMCEDLKFKWDRHEPDAIIACWLIQEGADPTLLNSSGKNVFDVCFRPDILRVTKTFYDRCSFSRMKTTDDQLPSLTSVSSDTQDCRLCRNTEPCMKFLPCEHIITCQNCAEYFKKCYNCDGMIESIVNINDISDCLVCDVNRAEVLFEPCGHIVVCAACSWRMKRCIYCKVPIDVMKNRDGSVMEQKVVKEDSKYVSLLETLKNLESKVKDMESLNTCSVCLDRPKNVVFLCGHGTCTICSTTLGHCPICRSSIDKKIVLFQ